MGFPYPKFLGPYQRDKLYSKTKPGPNGCIIWTGTISTGYPMMRVHGVMVGAYRVAWVLHNNKEIPTGYEIDHLCSNQLCVNPEHLEPVTRRENLRRRHGHEPAPPGSPDKECRTCGRLGTRGYRWNPANHSWYCTNESVCTGRTVRKTPSWLRCSNCRHQKLRHGERCWVINCTCSGWQE